MNLDSLNLFVDAMRFGNFAEVARLHDMAPSSVSRAIASLEQELGVRLFQRTTRKLTPTEAAAAFFHRINPVITEIDAARDAARDQTRQPGGTLRVTAPAVFASRCIVPLLPVLATTYPQLSLELIIDEGYLDLIEQRIDIAIRLGTLSDSSVVARRLAAMEFYLCASPAYLDRKGGPTEPHQIVDHESLLFPRAGYDLDWLFRAADGSIDRISIQGRYLITHSESILQCALAGMGLALLPDWLVSDAIESGALLRLFPEYDITATDFDSAIWLLYPSRSYLPLKSRLFIDFLLQRFR